MANQRDLALRIRREVCDGPRRVFLYVFLAVAEEGEEGLEATLRVHCACVQCACVQCACVQCACVQSACVQSACVQSACVQCEQQ